LRSRAGRRFAEFRHEVVVGEHQFAAGDDEVPGTDVAVREPVVVKDAERLAGVDKPTGREARGRRLLKILGQQRQEIGELVQRRSVHPGQKRHGLVLPPFPGDFEDGRPPSAPTQMRPGEAVRSEDSSALIAVVNHLGHIRAQVLLRGAVNLDDLKDGPDPAAPQAIDETILTVVEVDRLPLGPVAGRGCLRPRRRISEQPPARLNEFGQAAPPRRIDLHPSREKFRAL
jgi:hypothetical protein